MRFSCQVISNSCDPMECSPPGSSVHGILQTRILEWVSISFSNNAGNPGSIPGLGRSPGEWIGYPLQYSWASLVAKMIQNPPAMWETWVPSLGWEDPLEKGKERLPTPGHPFWPREIHGLYSLWGCKELDMTEQLSLS